MSAIWAGAESGVDAGGDGADLSVSGGDSSAAGGRPPVVEAGLEAEFWGEYLALQGTWRMGETLTLERWGRVERGDARGRQEMWQLRQELEALLVGFGE